MATGVIVRNQVSTSPSYELEHYFMRNRDYSIVIDARRGEKLGKMELALILTKKVLLRGTYISEFLQFHRTVMDHIRSSTLTFSPILNEAMSRDEKLI